MSLLRSAARRVRAAVPVLRSPPYVPPGHYYSPLTKVDDRLRALNRRCTDAPGFNLRIEQQMDLAATLAAMWADAPRDRYRPDNSMFGAGDAAVYHSMLRHLQPRRVIEVGSGFSTAVALDTAERHLSGLELTCIEPYPARLRSVLRPSDVVTIIEEPVQDVPLSRYAELGAGDVLFIDSTHVVKAGSDVHWLVLHVLPVLAPGVVIHFHDVFWPFEYPDPWLAEGRDWTENYLLHAFLAYNETFHVLLFNSWLWETSPELIAAHLPEAVGQRPGSLWLRKAT